MLPVTNWELINTKNQAMKWKFIKNFTRLKIVLRHVSVSVVKPIVVSKEGADDREICEPRINRRQLSVRIERHVYPVPRGAFLQNDDAVLLKNKPAERGTHVSAHTASQAGDS